MEEELTFDGFKFKWNSHCIVAALFYQNNSKNNHPNSNNSNLGSEVEV